MENQRDDIVCQKCGSSLNVVCYWRPDGDKRVYDGPYVACDCDEGEKMIRSGKWRREWKPRSDSDAE